MLASIENRLFSSSFVSLLFFFTSLYFSTEVGGVEGGGKREIEARSRSKID